MTPGRGTTITEPTAPAEAPTTDTEAGARAKHEAQPTGRRILALDPRTLEVDPCNHRQADENAPPPTPDFVALVRSVLPEHVADPQVQPDDLLIESVRQSGVHNPIHVRRTTTADDGAQGRWGIFEGQRRWLAALVVAAEAVRDGRPVPTVDAFVYDDLTDAETLVRSMEENKRRQDATVADDVRVLRQLDLLGLPQRTRKRTAKRLGYRADEIEAAGRLPGGDTDTLRRAQGEGFDVVELADYAEVKDVGGALFELRNAKWRDQSGSPNRRGHWAHAMQQLRARKAESDQRAAVTAELEAAGVPHLHPRVLREPGTRALSDLRTSLGGDITAEKHRDCPGHAAVIDPDTVEPVWVCTDWRKQRHRLTVEAEAAAAQGDEADEAAREERRSVIAGNRAWRDARPVRIAFLRSTVAAKQLPDELSAVALGIVMGGADAYAQYVHRRDTAVLAELLGVADPNTSVTSWQRRENPFGDVIGAAAKSRRLHLLWAHAAACQEERLMHDRAWRDPLRGVGEYLALLARHGYVLSEIEQKTIEEATPKKPADGADGGRSAEEAA